MTPEALLRLTVAAPDFIPTPETAAALRSLLESRRPHVTYKPEGFLKTAKPKPNPRLPQIPKTPPPEPPRTGRPGRPRKYDAAPVEATLPADEAAEDPRTHWRKTAITRCCLRCGKDFITRDKFTRLCGWKCREDNGSMAI